MSQLSIICFGTCVGPTDHYAKLALPSITSIVSPEDQILSIRGAACLATAYNSLIDDACAIPGIEALVLLHDDVVLQDKNFEAKVRRVLRDPSVGVVGVIGGAGLSDMRFWKGRTKVGRVWHEEEVVDFGTIRGEVDAVDGLLMVLSPSAMKSVRFDDETFGAFDGYDVDYCLSCKQAGLRVVVEPFDLYHLSRGVTNSTSYVKAEKAFERKWGSTLVRQPLRARSPRLDLVARELSEWASTLSPAVEHGKHLTNAFKYRTREAPTPVEPSPEAPVNLSNPECMLCGEAMAQTPSALPLLWCDNCQLGRTWPAPSVDNSSSEIFDTSFGGARLSRRQQWVYEAKQRLAWVESWTPEGQLLEVGCATGEFVNEAAAAGFDAFGIEPSEWAANFSRKLGAEVMQGILSDWISEFNGFALDAIAMFHVIEHLESPIEILQECASILADDGKLFLEVPNGASRAAKSFHESWPGWEFRFHQWHYTPRSIETLLNQAGLRVLNLHELSARPYTSRSEWGMVRAKGRAAGNSSPDLDYIRVIGSL